MSRLLFSSLFFTLMELPSHDGRPDLIACLYPFGDKCAKESDDVIKSKANRLRYVEPSLSPSLPLAEDPYNSCCERQPTQEPEECNHWDYPRLELRFSYGPKTSYGFVFGCDENCDVVLPEMRGISSRHFTLTFDNSTAPS